jgi:thiamine-monophosphate kinase
MAVRPLAATVSVALPADGAMDDARNLSLGMEAIAAEFDLALVGGDTTCWAHPLAIDVAITAAPYEGIKPVTRSGAKVGDDLYVTGALGGSLLGHHLSFTPRVREAKTLAETLGDRLHAMMDISDGLSLDLWRLCQASGVGASLSTRSVDDLVSEDAVRAASDGQTPLEHALTDGEDFELLVAVHGGSDIPPLPFPFSMIGRTVPSGMTMLGADGAGKPLEPRGFVH